MLMWKAPNRPNNQITQSFNDGLVFIYSVKNIAVPGYKPKDGLVKKIELRYEEQKLGINRLYLSRQNQAEIERVLRVPKMGDITTQDAAITEEGQQYKIDTIQTVPGVWPPCFDIALTAIKQKFEVVQ